MNGLAARHPDTNKETEPRLAPFRIGVGGPIRVLFGTLLGAVAFVLLIACANVANLLLARVAGRVREVSVRMAMGASRWRIVRQLLVENLLLAALAGACGLALSVGGIRLFWSVAQDTHPPYWLRFPFDLRVFGYLAAVCLGTTILFGLLPALQTARTNLVEVLNDAGRGATGGRRSQRWSGALIVGQIALTLVLLSGALAVVQNAVALTSQEAGVDTSRLLRLRIDLPATNYATPEQRVAFYRRLEDRVAGGATRVALANVPPLAGGRRRAVELTGQPARVDPAARHAGDDRRPLLRDHRRPSACAGVSSSAATASRGAARPSSTSASLRCSSPARTPSVSASASPTRLDRARHRRIPASG